MTIPKIYSATINAWTTEPRVIGYESGKLFEIIGGANHRGQMVYRCPMSDLTNLTELTLAGPNDVVIPDFNPRQLLFLMRLHALDRQNTWKPIVEAVQRQVGTSLISLREMKKFDFVGNDKTGCENCGYFNHQKEKCSCSCGHAQPTPQEVKEEITIEKQTEMLGRDIPIPSPTHPAKLEITLTEKERFQLLGLLEMAKHRGMKAGFNPTVTGEIDSFAAQVISRPFAPMPEPKEFGAVVEAGNDLLRKSKWDNYIIDEYVNVGENLWFNKRTRNSYEYKHLINPRRVGE